MTGESQVGQMNASVVEWMEGGRRILGEYFAFNMEGVVNSEECAMGSSVPSSPDSFSPSSSDNEGGSPILIQNLVESQEGKNGHSCLSISIYSAVVVAIVVTFLVIGRDYIKYLLMSLEESSFWVSLLIFMALFTAVSFPMTWGYIVLNIAAGYLYGFFLGVFIVMLCALTGIVVATLVIKKCLANFVMTKLANDSIRAIIRVVDSDHGFKMVALARLTPIPFGLQNALFAMSSIPLHHFVLASMMGMLPSQGMHAYIGSTLRSMEEVISDSGHSATTYAVFIAQLLMAVVLLVFVIRRARVEFNKAMVEAEFSKRCGSPILSVCSSNSQENMEKGMSMKQHIRNTSTCSLPPVHTGMGLSPRHGSKLGFDTEAGLLMSDSLGR